MIIHWRHLWIRAEAAQYFLNAGVIAAYRTEAAPAPTPTPGRVVEATVTCRVVDTATVSCRVVDAATLSCRVAGEKTV